MLATYKIVKSVNLPDQVGVNDNGKILMLDCEHNEYAKPGEILASYKGDLYDEHDMEVVIHVNGLDDFTIVARKNASNYCDDEDCDDDYYDEDDEIYYAEGVKDTNLLTVLGNAFAAVERELKKTLNTPCEKKKICKDESLRELKNILDAIFKDE